MTHQAHAVPPAVISTLDDAKLIAQAWFAEVHPLVTQGTVLSALLINHHWIPVAFCPTSHSIEALTTTEGARYWPMLFPDISPIQVFSQRDAGSLFHQDCGFQTVAWLLAHVMECDSAEGHLCSMPTQAANAWRSLFWQHLYVYPAIGHPPLLCLGGQSELETAVSMMLKEHGVFTDRLQERTKTVLHKFGAAAVAQAIRSARPWAALKDLANQHTPRFRLILEDEFQQIIKQRSSGDKPIGTKKRVATRSAIQSPVHFTPHDVKLPEGIFCQADGTPLASIGLREVNPSAKGVVLVIEGEYQPYASQKSLSTGGLAFLILAPYSETLASQGTAVRFPAKCIATSEPVLLSGQLVQKGQLEVARHLPAKCVQVETVETQTCKVLLYQDQCPLPWGEVVERPVRAVLRLLPFLQVCRDVGCNCGGWHVSQTSAPEPVLDIWQRDFLTIHFKRCKPHEAAVFTCMIRMTGAAYQEAIKHSGSSGIFIEARSQDGKLQDQRYHTVWLPKQSLEEARAAQSTTFAPTCLIRVSWRYGLRTDVDNAKKLHDQFRPDVPFLSGTGKSTWLLGPVPYGTTRRALQDLFASWSWEAKPLQSMGPSADRTGLKWQVAAATDPPNYVYTLAHGDVLITKATPQDLKLSVSGRVEASASTLQAVSMQPARQELVHSLVAASKPDWADASAK